MKRPDKLRANQIVAWNYSTRLTEQTTDGTSTVTTRPVSQDVMSAHSMVQRKITMCNEPTQDDRFSPTPNQRAAIARGEGPFQLIKSDVLNHRSAHMESYKSALKEPDELGITGFGSPN